MKNIRSLIMILIGMISFTTLASTPVLEQKQKPVIVSEFTQSINAVVVEDAFTLEVVIFLERNYSQTFLKKDSQKTNDLAIVSDVGWHSKIESKTIAIDRANLNYSYLPDIEKELQKLGLNQSRDNC